MTSSSLFYAYVHSVNDDNIWRLVVVFSSRSVADEWWRALTGTSDSVLTKSVQRIGPQFFTHDTTQINLVEFFYSARYKDISSQFRGRLFITLDNDRGGRGISILPVQKVCDHINGNWFFIRSLDDSRVYWSYDQNAEYTGQGIYASSTQRNRFRIVAADPNLPKTTVLIGSDKVYIQINDQLYVSVNNSGKLISSNEPHEFLFSDIDGGNFKGVDGSTIQSLGQNDLIAKSPWELA